MAEHAKWDLRSLAAPPLALPSWISLIERNLPTVAESDARRPWLIGIVQRLASTLENALARREVLTASMGLQLWAQNVEPSIDKIRGIVMNQRQTELGRIGFPPTGGGAPLDVGNAPVVGGRTR